MNREQLNAICEYTRELHVVKLDAMTGVALWYILQSSVSFNEDSLTFESYIELLHNFQDLTKCDSMQTIKHHFDRALTLYYEYCNGFANRRTAYRGNMSSLTPMVSKGYMMIPSKWGTRVRVFTRVLVYRTLVSAAFYPTKGYRVNATHGLVRVDRRPKYTVVHVDKQKLELPAFWGIDSLVKEICALGNVRVE